MRPGDAISYITTRGHYGPHLIRGPLNETSLGGEAGTMGEVGYTAKTGGAVAAAVDGGKSAPQLKASYLHKLQ